MRYKNNTIFPILIPYLLITKDKILLQLKELELDKIKMIKIYSLNGFSQKMRINYREDKMAWNN